MTKNELIEKLRAMRAAGENDAQVTVMTHLFGVLFDDEIRTSGSNGAEIGRALDRSGVAITDGRKLARYVAPLPEIVRQWKY